MAIPSQVIKIPTICPICKSKKSIEIPDSIAISNSKLTTISLPRGLVCDHHFQIFIDNDFKIRGYQKVDFEIKLGSIGERKDELKQNSSIFNDDKELFENLLSDGNYVEYRPANRESSIVKTSKSPENTSINGLMTLKEIYEEFWEFINDTNPEFENFILKDKRRFNLK